MKKRGAINGSGPGLPGKMSLLQSKDLAYAYSALLAGGAELARHGVPRVLADVAYMPASFLYVSVTIFFLNKNIGITTPIEIAMTTKSVVTQLRTVSESIRE
jgi:hypothetical protein